MAASNKEKIEDWVAQRVIESGPLSARVEEPKIQDHT